MSVTSHAPALPVVVESALPAAQLTLIVPLAIGKPTAATPPKVLAVGVALPPPLPPPLHPASNKAATAVMPMPSSATLRRVRLSFMFSPNRKLMSIDAVAR